MLVFTKIQSVRKYLKSLDKGVKIGFIPTMGALHLGHLSLLKRARMENSFVVVSIFVNPTQFDKKEDLVNYPQTLEEDLEKLKANGCNLVFTPDSNEIYENIVKSETFDFDGLDQVMEGQFRKGHFDGVGTIVKKLLDVIRPTRAYFGEKDFQQLMVIKNLVRKGNIPTKIIGCPIHRETDGLAMSSRNTRLTKAQRKAAPRIYSTLKEVLKELETSSIDKVKLWVKSAIDQEPELTLEYFEIVDETTLATARTLDQGKSYRAFIAVFAGEIRLIDNIQIQ